MTILNRSKKGKRAPLRILRYTEYNTRDGVVYFMRATDGGQIKIGFTQTHPMRRLASVQRGVQCPIELIGCYRAVASDEIALHARFADYHAGGEWFVPCPDLTSFIEKTCVADAAAFIDDLFQTGLIAEIRELTRFKRGARGAFHSLLGDVDFIEFASWLYMKRIPSLLLIGRAKAALALFNTPLSVAA